MNLTTEPSDEQQATPSNIRAALAKISNLTPNQSVCLLYPGAGWDFTSYWRPTDPDVVIMIDPAPVTLVENIDESFDEWKQQLIRQLDLPEDTGFENLTFDLETSQIRKADLEEWESIVLVDYEIESTFRPGFYSVFQHQGRERHLVYIASRVEDFSLIRQCEGQKKQTDFMVFPPQIQIVYEHKSNVPFDVLISPLKASGCLVWGLPDDNPTFQVLDADRSIEGEVEEE